MGTRRRHDWRRVERGICTLAYFINKVKPAIASSIGDRPPFPFKKTPYPSRPLFSAGFLPGVRRCPAHEAGLDLLLHLIVVCPLFHVPYSTGGLSPVLRPLSP